jgi:HlyD family secretion protein
MPKLRPGMSGTVEIYTQTTPNTVAVPIQAVTVRDFNKVRGGSDGKAASGQSKEDLRKVVFVAEADSARMVEVTTGIADETHIEIRSGLSGGEQVIMGPYSAVSRALSPGDKIRIQSENDQDGSVLASGL